MPAAKDRDEEGTPNRRRWSRYDLPGTITAVLVSEDSRIACRIDDVSLAGARLRLQGKVRPGAEVCLEYDRRPGPTGRCVWQAADSLGVSFWFSEESVELALACINRAAKTTTAPSETADTADGEPAN